MNFSMMDFNYFDVAIASIILILGIKGLMQGFIKEAFGLAGLVAGVYFGSRLSDTASNLIDQHLIHIENMPLMKLLGFLAILTLVWTGATLLGALFSQLTNRSGLGAINRMLGLIIGGGKYFIIFALIVTALSNVKLIQDNFQKYFDNSVLYPYLIEAGGYLIQIDPATLGFKTHVQKSDENNSSLSDVK